MFAIRLFLVFLVVTALAAVIAGQLGLFQGKAPSDLGAKDGQLKRPSKTENSVSSQADKHADHPMRDYAQIAPLSFTGDAARAWKKLQEVLSNYPRTSVVTNSSPYLYAQSTTLLLRFTDDVEFLVDADKKLIHVRSASRLGRKDFGTNRKRVEAIRASFAALSP